MEEKSLKSEGQYNIVEPHEAQFVQPIENPLIIKESLDQIALQETSPPRSYRSTSPIRNDGSRRISNQDFDMTASMHKGAKSPSINKGSKSPSILKDEKSLSIIKSNKTNSIAPSPARPESPKIGNGHKSPNLLKAKSPSLKYANSELNSPDRNSNIRKIEEMSNILTNEANALRESIKSLSNDLARTKEELAVTNENVDFPYHLFLLELIVNKIQMKCECYEFTDHSSIVLCATFLGKNPIVIYDASSYGRLENFSKLNVGKSTLFAMTYEKICAINEFEICLELTKQPPCSHVATKIGETRMDFTTEFKSLKEELCQQWTKEQPEDNIKCTTSTPLMTNKFYLSCGDNESLEVIGIVEVTIRMSFLGKEISTAFCKSPKPNSTSLLMQQKDGMAMYSCQKVEMDDGGKIVLDEEVLDKRRQYGSDKGLFNAPPLGLSTPENSLQAYKRPNAAKNVYRQNGDEHGKFDEIYTQMNTNELTIKVPKSTRVDRVSKYEKISELCDCEETPYNTGEQIQFELPNDVCYPGKNHDTHTSNLKYTYKGCDRNCEKKDRKVVNVTPTNCPVPVHMEKMVHPNKDVFILKIGKKLESKNKKTELEVELVTPKAPSTEAPAIANTSQQCTQEKKKKSKKTKGKKGAKKNKSKTSVKGGKSKRKK